MPTTTPFKPLPRPAPGLSPGRLLCHHSAMFVLDDLFLPQTPKQTSAGGPPHLQDIILPHSEPLFFALAFGASINAFVYGELDTFNT
ncbi:hypothetical protein Neosp_008153 [[Neocosmospora] mangrovei]